MKEITARIKNLQKTFLILPKLMPEKEYTSKVTLEIKCEQQSQSERPQLSL